MISLLRPAAMTEGYGGIGEKRPRPGRYVTGFDPRASIGATLSL